MDLYFYALDGVTLFGKQDLSGNAVDDLNGDGVPNADDLSHANPGIALNDINQGNLGDCWAMAALGALVVENWQHVQSLFVDQGGGNYAVWLWSASAGWEQYSVSIDLARGFDMAQLSGDVKVSQDEPGVARAEIWPILLEQAYAAMKGGYENIDHGGWTGELYTALTGATFSQPISTAGMSDDDILVRINNERGSGRQAVLNTKTTLSDGYPVVGHHSYTVIGCVQIDTNGDGINDNWAYQLYNPWGGARATVKIPVDQLNETVDTFEILDNVN